MHPLLRNGAARGGLDQRQLPSSGRHLVWRKPGSLSALVGQKVQLVVAMSDAKLFSMELSCKKAA
jgi:hypothetical protein